MESLGPYLLLAELGRGGMGAVFRARREDLGREFALKVILQGEGATAEAVERFRREAQAAARLADHPGIVGVHDIGEDAGRVYFAMDLVEGQSLEERLHEGPLAPAEAARILEQVCRAVAHAHREGILHRDLKPGNVLVGYDGAARVADFGLAVSQRAEEATARLTHSGVILGTPSYMPPEQARGEALDPRADVYALGATLYEALLGVPPFDGDSLYDVLNALLRDDAVPLRRRDPRIPRDLETIVMRCLEKEPARRYPTADALADDLGRFLRSEPILARRPTLIYRVRKAARRHPAVTTSVALATLLATGYFAGPGWVAIGTPAGSETRLVWPAVTQELAVAWPEHEPQRAEVPVRPWSTVAWDPPRILDHGFLQVRTDPPGAAVRIAVDDGAPVTAVAGADAIRVPTGTHRVELSLEGHEVVRDAVTIAPGGRGTLEKRLPPLQGTLTMSCDPTGVRLTLTPLDAQRGTPSVHGLPITTVMVPAARYRARLEKENHFPRELEVTVPPPHDGRPRGITTHGSLQPMLRWSARLEGSAAAAPAFADLNLDGVLDVIWASGDGVVQAHDGSDGRRLWRRALISGVSGTFVVVDADADAIPDVVCTTGMPACTALSGRDGRVIWTTALPASSDAGLTAGDLDGDGRTEIVGAGDDGSVWARDAATGGVRWNASAGLGIEVAPQLADVDGDGAPEVLLVGKEQLYLLSGRDGARRWDYRMQLISDNLPHVFDCDGDGALEVVTCAWDGRLYVLDAATGKEERTQMLTDGEQSAVTCFTATDGAPRCLAVDSQGRLRLLHGATGATLWERPLSGPTWAPPVVVDADGDGRLECVLATHAGWVHTLDAATGAERWRFGFRGGVRAPPVAADIDGDGRAEIAVTAFDGGAWLVHGAPSRERWRRRLPWQARQLQVAGDIDRDGHRDFTFTSGLSFRALSGRTANELWHLEFDRVASSYTMAPDLNQDGIPDYLLLRDRRLRAISGADGADCWRSTPVLAEGGQTGWVRVRAADVNGDSRADGITVVSGGVLHCFNGADGGLLWKSEGSGGRPYDAVAGPLDAAAGAEVVVGYREGAIVAHGGRDGAVLWTHRAGGRLLGSLTLAATESPQQLDCVYGIGHEIRAVAGRTGTPLWRATLGSTLGRVMAVHDADGDGLGDLLVTVGSVGLQLRSARTGRMLWRARAPARGPAAYPQPAGDLDGDGTPDYLVPSTSGAWVISGRAGTVVGVPVERGAAVLDGTDLLISDPEEFTIVRTELPGPPSSGRRRRALRDVNGSLVALRDELAGAVDGPRRSGARRRVAARAHAGRLRLLLSTCLGLPVKDRLHVLSEARTRGLRCPQADADWVLMKLRLGALEPTELAGVHPECAWWLLRPRLDPSYRERIRTTAQAALNAQSPIGLRLLAGDHDGAAAALEQFDAFAWERFAWQALLLLERGDRGAAQRCVAVAAGLEPDLHGVARIAMAVRSAGRGRRGR